VPVLFVRPYRVESAEAGTPLERLVECFPFAIVTDGRYALDPGINAVMMNSSSE
jgi:hypothetical protein